MTEDWRENARCAGVENADKIFFPAPSRSTRKAKELCRDCPSRVPCLEDALATNAYGVWGGTSEDERATLKRRRRRGQSPDTQTRPPLTPEAHEDRLKAYRSGLTDPQIAESEGVNPSVIARWRRANNLTDNYTGRFEVFYQQFQALYDLGCADGEIAATTGQDRDRVRRWRNRSDLPLIKAKQRVTA